MKIWCGWATELAQMTRVSNVFGILGVWNSNTTLWPDCTYYTNR